MLSSGVPRKPRDVLDRDAEWRALSNAWESPGPELLFVLGRRRIGKSFLLSRFAKRVKGVYYQATRRTEAEQLASVSLAVGERFGDAALSRGASMPSWEALLAYITERGGDEPFLLVLDEFPYLASAAPALPSIVQKLWDHDWSRTRIRLVLAGSYVTAMHRLEAGDQPLFGRRTRRISFDPFTAADLAGFVPDWTPRDRLRLHGVAGHLPGHLALIDPDASLEANLARLFFDPAGRLVDEAQHMLDAFLGEADVHYSILEAIAGGDRTWSGITSRVGKAGGAVSRPLQWLEAMDVIERVVPITEKIPKRSKRAVYRVADPYVEFWHTFVAPALRSGSIGLAKPELLVKRLVSPRLDDYMGGVFERVCREHARRASTPFEPLRVGSWWDARSRNEVDVVSLSGDGEVYVAECKWGPVTRRHFETLRERARILAAELPRVTRVHYGLYSGRGEFDDALRELASRGEVSLYGPDDVT